MRTFAEQEAALTPTDPTSLRPKDPASIFAHLATQAYMQRYDGAPSAGNPVYPDLLCAGPGCLDTAVESFWFCSKRCRERFETAFAEARKTPCPPSAVATDQPPP